MNRCYWPEMSAGPRRCSGCFQRRRSGQRAIEVGEFVTLAYDGLEPMLREFLRAQNVDPKRIEAACFGVAGAVTGQVARLTNVPWLVEAAVGRSGVSISARPRDQ